MLRWESPVAPFAARSNEKSRSPVGEWPGLLRTYTTRYSPSCPTGDEGFLASGLNLLTSTQCCCWPGKPARATDIESVAAGIARVIGRSTSAPPAVALLAAPRHLSYFFRLPPG